MRIKRGLLLLAAGAGLGVAGLGLYTLAATLGTYGLLLLGQRLRSKEVQQMRQTEAETWGVNEEHVWS